MDGFQANQADLMTSGHVPHIPRAMTRRTACFFAARALRDSLRGSSKMDAIPTR